MYDVLASSTLVPEADGARRLGCTLGKVTLIAADRTVFVDFEGNEHEPLAARVVTPTTCEIHAGDLVMLMFEQGDPALPIILGAVADRLPRPKSMNEEVELTIEGQSPASKAARLDGKKIVLDAREEIVLRCGKSSITLRKDGRILVKGKELVSHATGTNRVKGSSVAIN